MIDVPELISEIRSLSLEIRKCHVINSNETHDSLWSSLSHYEVWPISLLETFSP